MRINETDLEQFFYGSATVGERGQVVVPAEARKACGMNSGDKLLVFRHPMHPSFLILGRVSDMWEMHQHMTELQQYVARAIARAEENETGETE